MTIKQQGAAALLAITLLTTSASSVAAKKDTALRNNTLKQPTAVILSTISKKEPKRKPNYTFEIVKQKKRASAVIMIQTFKSITKEVINPKDPAQTAVSPYGGIDLNAANLNLQIKCDW